MAEPAAENAETNGLFSRASISTLEDIPFSIRPPIEMPIRNQDEYPTTSTTNLPYNQSASATPEFSLTTLTTIIISKTATITLTTIEFITSESTITTVAPPSAPLLSSKPTTVVLSSGQIAGAVIGAIFGLLIFVLLFYLILTRAKWMTRLSDYRLDKKEKEHRRMKPRSTKRAKRLTETTTRTSRSGRSTDEGKPMQPKRTSQRRPQSTTGRPEQWERRLNERRKAFEAGILETREGRNAERKI